MFTVKVEVLAAHSASKRVSGRFNSRFGKFEGILWGSFLLFF